MRRIKMLLVSAIIAGALSTSTALADTHTVNSVAEITNALNADTSNMIIFNLGSDIELGELTTKDNVIYVFNGNGNVIKNVTLKGAGEVNINGNVSDTGTTEEERDTISVYDRVLLKIIGNIISSEDAINAYGNSVVIMTGNIIAASDGVYANDDSYVTIKGNIVATKHDGVDTSDNATVIVTGNINAGDNGVEASDASNVTVNGNIEAGGNGVEAEDASNVIVNGNIEAEDDGVDASDASNVTVNGNIEAEDDGVEAGETSNVTVNGNIAGGDYGIDADENSTVTVTGNVKGGDGNPEMVDLTNPMSYSDGKYGICASGNSTVNVTGNVEGGIGYGSYGYGGSGIVASDNSKVKIDGNVKGGDAIANPEQPVSSYYNSRGGIGIFVSENAKIEVNGNVKGGSTNGKYGDAGMGIFVDCSMFNPDDKVKIVVNGLVESGKGEQSTTPIRTTGDGNSFIPDVLIWKAGSTPVVSGDVDFDTQFIVKVNQPENGSISVDKDTAKAGEKVTITVKADDGYKIKRVLNGDTVLTANEDGTYTVEVGENGGLDIRAEMEKLPNKDVSPQTGDNGFGIALIMMILSLCGICLTKKQNA